MPELLAFTRIAVRGLPALSVHWTERAGRPLSEVVAVTVSAAPFWPENRPAKVNDQKAACAIIRHRLEDWFIFF